MHVNTDEDGFVKTMDLRPNNVHDSQELDKLLGIQTIQDKDKNKEKIKTYGEVYADSAYANKQNDKKLGKQNNKILHRAYRKQTFD